MSRALGVGAVYLSNAVGALGHLLLLKVVTGTAGFEGYALLSLYLLAFSVLQVFEAAVVRRAVDLSVSPQRTSPDGLFLAWAGVAIALGLAGAIVLAGSVLDFEVGPWFVFVAVTAGVLDYVLGIPITRYCVELTLQRQSGRIAGMILVQNLTRYSTILLLANLESLGPAYLALVPLRRVVDGLVLYVLVRHRQTDAGAAAPSRLREILSAFGRYGSITAFLVLGTEGTALAIAVLFGEFHYGQYRATFDLASKLWFVTSIFPLIIYPRLKGMERNARTLERIARALRISWIAYLAVAAGAWLIVGYVFEVVFPALRGSEWLFLLVVAGVAMNAHSRFGLECLQAFDRPTVPVSMAAGFAIVMLALFLISAQFVSFTASVGVAWLGAGLVFALTVDDRLLRIFGASAGQRATAWAAMLGVAGAAGLLIGFAGGFA